jgi:DNA repair protein RecO (recombination protein O)
LLNRDAEPAGRDLADGFALTGFFLARHVLEPRGLALSDERAHFIAAILRGPRSALAV